jgi:hypothetical protein
MSDQEFKSMARNVRQIRNMKLYPAVINFGCLGLIVAGLVALILFVGLAGVIGRLTGL